MTSAAPPVDGTTHPSRSEFRDQAQERRVVPVVRRLLADGFTPVGLYVALTGGRPGSFLLESAETGRSWSRYSIVGVNSTAMLTSVDGQARWLGTPPPGVPADGDPLEALRDTIEALSTPRSTIAHLPPFTSGMVGCIGYDAVRRWERLPDLNPDELRFPEIAMLLASDVAVLDHHDGTVLLIANVINAGGADGTDDARVDAGDAYDGAVARLDAMVEELAQAPPLDPLTLSTTKASAPHSRSGQDKYLADVEVAREHIHAGDAFQIVLSQRFEAPCPASALDVYRVLRATNPSPYMYLIRLPRIGDAGSSPPADPARPAGRTTPQGAPWPDAVGFDVVGSSPEALVTVKDGSCRLHPIAGTRPRSADPGQDARLASELLADDKERAEHLMLVDLGRNDLGKVCQTGTVEVVEFMAVERYSHVMHLVSTVVGDLASGRTAYDALAATFPAGTLSGAPKPRAMEIIEDLEPARRGLYAGAVGYLDFAGDLDTAIAIRTALIADGVAHVQAGAGLVADSVPEMEDEESRNKAAAVLDAVATAATLRPAVEDGARRR